MFEFLFEPPSRVCVGRLDFITTVICALILSILGVVSDILVDVARSVVNMFSLTVTLTLNLDAILVLPTSKGSCV